MPIIKHRLPQKFIWSGSCRGAGAQGGSVIAGGGLEAALPALAWLDQNYFPGPTQ